MARKNEFTAERRMVDENRCEFTCRLVEDPKITLRKTRFSPTPVAFTEFLCVNNPSLHSKSYAAYFVAYAWGKLAQDAFDRLKKGYSIFCICKYHSYKDAVVDVKGRRFPVQYGRFEIKEFMLRAIPEPKDPEPQDEPLPNEPEQPL